MDVRLRASDAGRRRLFFGLPLTLFDEFSNVPTLVAVMVLLVVLSSAGKWLSTIRSLHGTVDQTLNAVGSTGIAVVVTVGTVSVMNEAIHIVT